MFEAAVIVALGFQKICLHQVLLLRHPQGADREPTEIRPKSDRNLTGSLPRADRGAMLERKLL